ncbi:MAG: glycosyltransferase family 39 protein [Deltaproteobacteria bacterium]|nr:glycosyltransferase family 39 protein [Deltaproteobacteria bacterium]
MNAFRSSDSDRFCSDLRAGLFYLFLLGLTLRTVHLAASADNPLLYMPVLDEAYYVELGRAIAAGNLLGEDGLFFMDPLYGYFLGGLFFLFGDNLTTVRLVQIGLDSVNILLIYGIGTRVYGKRAGAVSAFLYALYPIAFFYSLLILKTTVAVTLLLASVLMLLGCIDSGRRRDWLFLGLLLGLMTYLWANLILMLPLSVVFILSYQKMPWRKSILHCTIVLAGFAIMLVPGVLRNYASAGELALMNTQGGRLLYACNNPFNLTGRYNVPVFSRAEPVFSEKDFHAEAERRLGRPLTRKAVSRYWAAETFRFLNDNPGVVPVLLYNKLKGSIGHCEIPTNHSYESAARFSPLLGWPFPFFSVVLALGVPGLVIGVWQSRKAVVLLLPILATLTTILVFYTSSRLRMPAVPFLIIGTGICMPVLWNWIRMGRWGKASMAVAASGIILLVSVSIPCPPKSGGEEFFLAKAYHHIDELEKARQTALEGAATYPRQARFQVLLGMIAGAEEMPEKAIEHNVKALQLDPGNVDAWHNMGLIYFETGRPKEAVRCFEKALALEERAGTRRFLEQARQKICNKNNQASP